MVSTEIIKNWGGGKMGGQKIILGGHLPPLPPPWRRHCVQHNNVNNQILKVWIYHSVYCSLPPIIYPVPAIRHSILATQHPVPATCFWYPLPVPAFSTMSKLAGVHRLRYSRGPAAFYEVITVYGFNSFHRNMNLFLVIRWKQQLKG